jgi:hypothetical protein
VSGKLGVVSIWFAARRLNYQMHAVCATHAKIHPILMRLGCHVHIPAEKLIDRLSIAERYSHAMNFLEFLFAASIFLYGNIANIYPSFFSPQKEKY